MNAFSVSQAIIAAMITPALLIMASGSLIATGTARLGRIMDRVRELAEDDEKVERQVLQIYERRAILSERALQVFFAAIVVFVAVGVGIGLDRYLGSHIVWLPVGLTVIGMGLLVVGSALMLQECRLATRQIRGEMQVIAHTH